MAWSCPNKEMFPFKEINEEYGIAAVYRIDAIFNNDAFIEWYEDDSFPAVTEDLKVFNPKGEVFDIANYLKAKQYNKEYTKQVKIIDKQKLISGEASIPFDLNDISTGNYSRYASVKNVLDQFKSKLGIDYEIVQEPDVDWAGQFKDGKVYVNASKVTATTPIHEYMHPVMKQIIKDNPKLYTELVRDLQENYSDVLAYTRENYPELSGRDLMEESIVQVMGKLGLAYYKNSNDPWTKATKKVMDFLKSIFGNIFGKGTLHLSDLPSNFSIKDVVESVMLSSKVAVGTFTGTVNKQKAAETVTNVVTKLTENKKNYSKKNIENELLSLDNKYLDPSGKTERYVEKSTGKVIQGRVTDVTAKEFVNKVGVETATEITQRPDTNVKAMGGNVIHATAEYYLSKAILNDTSGLVNKSGIESNLEIPKGVLSPIHLNSLKDYVNNLFKNIIEQQKEIDPQGKVTILPEALLIDEIKDRGGSIDVLALFSDASATIYDFKSFTPYLSDISSETGRLINDPIQDYKLKAYNQQIGEYKSILKNNYGIATFRKTRIIPIRVDYKLKPKENRVKDSYLESKISRLEIGSNVSEFLEQIPVAYEQTGDAKLDKFIHKQVLLLKNLEQQLDSAPYNKKQEITNRINSIKTSIKKLQLDKDVNYIVGSTKQLIKELVGGDMMSGKLNIEDKDNPDYLDFEKLLIHRDELDSLLNLSDVTDNIINDLLETNTTKGKNLRNLIITVQGTVKKVYDQLEEKIAQRVQEISEEYGEDILNNPAVELNKIGIFKRLSEIDNPVFQTFHKILSKKQNEIRFKRKEVQQEVNTLINNMLSSGIKNFDLLFNPKTGNMYSKTSKDFWKERDQAIKDNNVAWFKENYTIKDKYSDIENRKKQYEEKIRGQIVEIIDPETDEVLKSKSEAEKEIQAKIKVWDQFNNPDNMKYWTKGNYTFQSSIKEETLTKYESEEYKRIKQNKPIFEFYQFVERRNKEFRELLGVDYQKLPDNFLPKMRKDLIERLTHGGAGDFIKNFFGDFVESMKIKESEEGIRLGIRDPHTGEIRRSIPMYFLNDIRDKGRKNIDAQTKELGTAMVIFSEMAYNFEAMQGVEAEIEALATILETDKVSEIITDPSGNKVIDFSGDWAKKLSTNKSAIDSFRAFQDRYIYGIKLRNAFQTDEIAGISKTKTLLKAKNYMAAKMLGFGIVPGAATYVAGRLSLYYEGVKGQYYTKASSKKAMNSMANSFTKYHAIAEFFEPFQESYTRLMANKASLRGNYKIPTKLKTTKSSIRDMLFAPYRKADERIDIQITNAMSHEWGVDENGDIMRMDRLTEHFEKLNADNKSRGLKKIYEAKSIWELSSYDEKTQKFVVEGLSDEGYTVFRNAIRKAASGIKGLMTDEDIKQADTHLMWNLVMQFKNWMPGILHERFGAIKYDKELDIVSKGRYRVVGNELLSGVKKEDIQGIPSLLWTLKTIGVNSTKIAFHISTFGLPKKFGVGYKVNEEQAKREYNKFIEQNPQLNPEANKKGVSFQAYVRMKQGQTETAIIELRALVLFTSLIAFMGGDWDDDGEKDFKDLWATRMLHKFMSRAELELAFAINPLEYQRLLTESPIPVTRIITDIGKTASNTFDEIRDSLYGENSPQDKSPALHYSSQWIVGVRQLRRVFDMIFKGDDKKEY